MSLCCCSQKIVNLNHYHTDQTAYTQQKICKVISIKSLHHNLTNIIVNQSCDLFDFMVAERKSAKCTEMAIK